MKFKIHIKTQSEDWWETYTKLIDDPHEWAKEITDQFNRTLRPKEQPRELIEVIIEDDANDELHDWFKRTDGMSVVFRGSFVDIMECRKCGITGKRFGIGAIIKIDSKYKKKVFQKCNTAKIELNNMREEGLI